LDEEIDSAKVSFEAIAKSWETVRKSSIGYIFNSLRHSSLVVESKIAEAKPVLPLRLTTILLFLIDRAT
jgi:hypothetical protein